MSNLHKAAKTAEAFIGVMFGDTNGNVPERVTTPLGISVKLREIYMELSKALKEDEIEIASCEIGGTRMELVQRSFVKLPR